jgi:hypothetical protein
MTENRIWYVNVNRQTYGPYSSEEIISMLRTETVKYSDYIFKEGFKNWDFLYNVPEFDRRILNPGGDQPLVHAPKEAAPQEIIPQEKAEESGKPVDELWYIHDGEHQTGPYTANYIKESLDNKTVFWTYFVWKEGFDNWVQIKECKEFDRRKTPRGQAPTKVDISTDYDEIKKVAVSSLPKKEDAPQIYGGSDMPSNFQYGISDLDQEELRGKYPIKGILALLAIVALLFGIVRAYPFFSERSREKRAMTMYESGVDLIEKQNKQEEGFQKLFDLMDMYPNSTAERKNENYIRSKEPMLKGQLADEARKIKTLIESFDKKYGVLPANSMDLGYVPPFLLKYFGEAYFKRSGVKKVEVLVRGVKLPVETYTFSTDSDNKDTEQDLKQDEFALKSRLYTKLSYTGRKSLVKPLELPRLLNSTVLSPERQKEAKEQAAAIAKKEQTQKRQETTKRTTSTRRKTTQDERIPVYDDQENTDEEQQVDQPQPQDEEFNQEETTPPDEDAQGAPIDDEYGDAINKIKKEK